jgi:catechol 2,3-dioxygenase-like lactoylglutathione lyase family enzyme
MSETTTSETTTSTQTATALPRPVLDVVAIDCPDAASLAAFYAGILGWEVHEDSDDDDDWVTILPPGAGEGSQGLAFQQIDDYVAPTWPGGEHPQQFHLDLRVPDLGEGEQVVVAAGATRHEHQPAADGGFVVYLDPAGHPFCLVS